MTGVSSWHDVTNKSLAKLEICQILVCTLKICISKNEYAEYALRAQVPTQVADVHQQIETLKLAAVTVTVTVTVTGVTRP